MADPLSMAASVTGLLAVAGKISAIIIEFVTTIADAPKSARAALGTVEEMKLVLASVKHMMDDGLSNIPENRKEMVHISKLVVLFRESIMSLSELEAIVTLAARTDGRRFKWSQIKWILEQGKISRCVQRLESNKASLSAMLNILHCESDREAQTSLKALQDAMQQVMQQNQAILHRFEQCNLHLRTDDASIRFLDDDVSTIRAQSTLRGSHGSASHLPDLLAGDRCVQPQAALHDTVPSRDFEITLKTTRVYRRVQSNQCDMSFTSSAVRTHAWSALSDLSLSDISAISIIALPISLEEINSLGAHLTFGEILSSTWMSGVPHCYEVPLPGDPSANWPLVDPDLDQHLQREVIQMFKVAQANVNSFWVPQAKPDGTLFFFDTLTGESTLELPSGALLPLGQAEVEHEESVKEQNDVETIPVVTHEISPHPPSPTNHSSTVAPVSAIRHANRPDLATERVPLSSLELQNTKLDKVGVKSPESIAPPKNHGLRFRAGPYGFQKHYKIVMLGDGGIDKTALTIQLCLNNSKSNYDPTIDDSYRRTVKIDDEFCDLEILDTAGQEGYTAFTDSWIKGGDGFIIVYSICNRSSFKSVESFHSRIERVKETSWPSNAPTMLVGNHCHRESEREVSTEEAAALAKRLECQHIEVSAKRWISVEKAFYDVVRMIRQQRSDRRDSGRSLATIRAVG